MIWKISQFPELDHLDPEQRANVLRTLPWWTYPTLVFRTCAFSGFLGLLLAMITALLFSRGQSVVFVYVLCLGAAALSPIVYQGQLQKVRAAMRKAVEQAFRFERPPFCFECGYDLRESTGERCPECGKTIMYLQPSTTPL